MLAILGLVMLCAAIALFFLIRPKNGKAPAWVAHEAMLSVMGIVITGGGAMGVACIIAGLLTA